MSDNNMNGNDIWQTNIERALRHISENNNNIELIDTVAWQGTIDTAQSSLPKDKIIEYIYKLVKREDLAGDIAGHETQLLVDCWRTADEQIGSLFSQNAEMGKDVISALQLEKLREIWDSNNLAKTVSDIFIKDLYKDSMHFFCEILQNVDDAQPQTGFDKSLTISIVEAENKMVFSYSDRGFNFSDVYGLCSIGMSTKKAKIKDGKLEAGSIGEKGIGFKSIFAVVEKVHIRSTYFSFDICYDTENASTILFPSNFRFDGTGEKRTEMELFLKQSEKEKKITYHTKEGKKEECSLLEAVDRWLEENLLGEQAVDNAFLFLKNIEQICYKKGDKSRKIEIHRDNIFEKKSENIAEGYQLAKITIRDITEDKLIGEYIKYAKKYIFEEPEILERWPYLEESKDGSEGPLKTDCLFEICYPINISDEDIKAAKVKGRIYSYLPTTVYLEQYPVFINLDIHLTASRGNISVSDFAEGSSWNKKVKKILPEFLVCAVMDLITPDRMPYIKKEYDSFYAGFYKYLPIKDTWVPYSCKFSGVVGTEFLNELNTFARNIVQKAIVYSAEGDFQKERDICDIEFDEKAAYLIMDKLKFQIATEKKYPFNLGWCEWLKKARWSCNKPWNELPDNSKYNFIYGEEILESLQNQRKESVLEALKSLESEERIAVLDSIDKVCKRRNTAADNLKEKIRLVAIEPEEEKREMPVIAIAEADKEIFFHNDSMKDQEKDAKCYFAVPDYFGKGEDEEKKKEQEALSGLWKTLGIEEYDPVKFFGMKVKEIGSTDEDIDEGKLIRLVEETYVVCHGHLKEAKTREVTRIKAGMNHYIIGSQYYEGLYDELTDICEDYVKCLEKEVQSEEIKDRIKMLNNAGKFLPENLTKEDRLNRVRYLIELGLKCRIQDTEEGGIKRFDLVSEELLKKQGYETTDYIKTTKDKEENVKAEVAPAEDKKLLIYYLEKLEEYKIDINQYGSCFGIEGKNRVVSVDPVKLNRFLKILRKSPGGEALAKRLNNPKNEYDGLYILTEKKAYIPEFNKESEEEWKRFIGTFMSTPRVVHVFNQVFEEVIHWPVCVNFSSVDDLLIDYDLVISSAPLKKDSEWRLLNKGWKVDKWESVRQSVFSYIDEKKGEGFAEKVKSLCMQSVFAENKVEEIGRQFIDENCFVYRATDTNDNLWKTWHENYCDNPFGEIIIKRDENGEEEKCYLGLGYDGENEKLSELFIEAMKYVIYKKKLSEEPEKKHGEEKEKYPRIRISDDTKNRIKGMFDEREVRKKRDDKQTNPMKYTDFLFGRINQDNIDDFLDNRYKKIWFQKENEDVEQLKLYGDYDLVQKGCKTQGYRNVCPICGVKSEEGKAGMKFTIRKNDNPDNPSLLYLLTCLNCNAMLERAEEIEILNLSEIIKKVEEENGYYLADARHRKNLSKMMTAELRIKSDGVTKIVEMKVSYENMLYYIADKRLTD